MLLSIANQQSKILEHLSIQNPKSKIQDRDCLVVRDLRKSYSSPAGAKLEVLRGVSFSVAAGEMVAIVGASGAGKSTLLHLLGGLEAADSGSLHLDQLDITRAEGAALESFRRQEVGFVFQFHHLLADLTAIENVALPLLIGRATRRASISQASDILKQMGLGQRLSHRISHLSGGEQQRVAVARAIVTSPRLLLADEPTGNLDARMGDEIGALLSSYCHTRKAVTVVATHNERLARICDRVLLLEDGQLKADA